MDTQVVFSNGIIATSPIGQCVKRIEDNVDIRRAKDSYDIMSDIIWCGLSTDVLEFINPLRAKFSEGT